MRDIAITLFIAAWLPLVVVHPWIGAILYAWFSVMNPHKLAFGWAMELPFAQVIALLTLVGLVISKDAKRLPGNAPVVVLVMFFVWTSITTTAAIEVSDSYVIWEQWAKNFIMLMITLAVVNTRRQVDYLAWAMVIAIGFYSFKGGVFTVLSGGQYRVWGPAGGKIQENNALAVATIMVIPLMRFVQLHSTIRWVDAHNKWVRRGLTALMVASVLSALGSQSRGALVAIGAMGLMFWWKSKRKILIGMGIAVVAAGGLYVMSEKWEERMRTITTYEEDNSAVSRLFAWETMYNIAKDRPLVGGGFEVALPHIYQRYSPDPTITWVIVAHSIYFEVLGQHGFAGLSLFLLLWFVTWRTASRMTRISRGRDDLRWAYDLAAMSQVSLVAYLVGGAFLNLAFFELPYYILIMLVTACNIADAHAARAAVGSRTRSPSQHAAVDAVAGNVVRRGG